MPAGALIPLLLVALAAPAAAQQAAAPPGQAFAEQLSVGYVLVQVTVRSHGGFVTDLERGDFHLEVDGEPVTFDSFERGEDAPVSLAFLQDLSGSMALGGKLDRSRDLLDCLLDRGRPGDRFALATFAGKRLEVEVPFGEERTPLREAADAWRGYGVTALHDAVARIPELVASRAQPNVVALLITDGVENASTMTPEESREAVRRARIPVYPMGFETGAESAGTAPGDGDRYSGVLRRLAAFTGGRYFALRQPSDVESACVQISIELRSRYVLGFPTAETGSAAYRTLRVKVDRPGLQIAHRLGYSGPPPAPSPAVGE
jgi:VWFA-related protein